MRERSLPTITNKYRTERGNIFIAVALSEEQPYEVFGWAGKGGSFDRGVTELVCRLISVGLQNGVSVASIIKQCENMKEMQPWPNNINGDTVMIKGLGDCISHTLRNFQ